MRRTDVFISGGGSLLQDVTSFKSLIYYLGLIFLAKCLKTRIFVYAQGIGPIKSRFGLLLTRLLLKKVDLITVRDQISQDFLKESCINSILTADPVWNIETKENLDNTDKSKIKIGIQLREWEVLNDKTLKILANVIESNFNTPKYQLVLLSLQDSKDLAVMSKFEKILSDINPELNILLKHNLSIFDSINQINQLNFLIGMRFHANLISIKYNIPTLAISYDPKVKSLAIDAGIPFISIDDFDENLLDNKIKDFITKKFDYKSKLQKFSKEKEFYARQNIDLLIKMIEKI